MKTQINDLYCYDLARVAPQLVPMTWELFYYEESRQSIWRDIQRTEQFSSYLDLLLRFMDF